MNASEPLKYLGLAVFFLGLGFVASRLADSLGLQSDWLPRGIGLVTFLFGFAQSVLLTQIKNWSELDVGWISNSVARDKLYREGIQRARFAYIRLWLGIGVAIPTFVISMFNFTWIPTWIAGSIWFGGCGFVGFVLVVSLLDFWTYTKAKSDLSRLSKEDKNLKDELSRLRADASEPLPR